MGTHALVLVHDEFWRYFPFLVMLNVVLHFSKCMLLVVFSVKVIQGRKASVNLLSGLALTLISHR
jgi:hypothetical protein